MRCPVVVGRDGELAAVARAVQAARRGVGGTLLVVGEAGVGKSRLAAEAKTLAGAEGLRVLCGRAAQDFLPRVPDGVAAAR